MSEKQSVSVCISWQNLQYLPKLALSFEHVKKIKQEIKLELLWQLLENILKAHLAFLFKMSFPDSNAN